MKITLTETLIDSLTSLSPDKANLVLNTCRELMKLDNDAIEQYELPDDTPQPLRDIVANMKKRAIAARRRRERRAAQAKTPNQPTTPQATNTPSATTDSNPVDPAYRQAISLLFSDTAISTPEHHALMHRLIVFITERINPTRQPAVQPKTRRKKRRNCRRHITPKRH